MQQVKEEKPKKCSNGHIMRKFEQPILRRIPNSTMTVPGDSLNCDKCAIRIFARAGYYHCGRSECNYDLCLNCGKPDVTMKLTAAPKSEFEKQLLNLATTRPSLALLENFSELQESQ